ncbi:DNA helicase-2 / ATP-dependent DNA helicase PcrA [Gracilibacillus orientalis]|uniref:DNA helicase-2 / ATP-dependent DNA helicase PcrA n=1 Tax=Gracilibacillus orientalis TaxID=334253 RepID=A0A1I4J403_9BACI|nr:ATP-dependent helicase [Gracilibacillus orientalis]SFL61348.1 DNA helicase-2 / ATP-dependent DNA helicase PcrA [Gracilibacillus orientalis]
MYKPTIQQQDILDCDENCVVIAGPGSGKTSTIAHKIRSVSEGLRWFEGIAAISYTNKASNELKQKTYNLGLKVNNSFFGTIDSFYIGNIIIPFGKRFFGLQQQNIVIDKLDSSNDTYVNRIISDVNKVVERYKSVSVEKLDKDNIIPINEIDRNHFDFISRKFKEGIFDIRLISSISNIIFLSSKACRKYFKSRFKYLFIDEFQDSGKDQYYLFLRISEIGVKCWGIGDINQSIFRFASKSSEFLKELLTNANFINFPMDINHRCHPSIDLYSRKLLGYDEKPIGSENRVYKLFVDGTECDIGRWFEHQMEEIKQMFGIEKNSSIGILATKDITLAKFLEHIDIPHKFYKKSILDQDKSPCNALLSKLLEVAFDKKHTVYNFINDYFDREISSHRFIIKEVSKLVNQFKRKLNKFRSEAITEMNRLLYLFSEITAYIYPDLSNQSAIENLEYLLKNKSLLNDFIPAKDEEVQLMNLHKSKGMEFDVVVHLDLYQFILPVYDWIVKEDLEAYVDSLNLHYVGVTRAKKALFLTSSSKRFQTRTENFINAEQSEFLIGDVERFQTQW